VYAALGVALGCGADVDEKDGSWELWIVEFVISLFGRQTLQSCPCFGKNSVDPCGAGRRRERITGLSDGFTDDVPEGLERNQSVIQ
jgi:hypothetical protein